MSTLAGLLTSAALLESTRQQVIPGRLPVAMAMRDSSVRILGPRRIVSSDSQAAVRGSSVFLADVETGRVLYAKDAHRLMPIASLTKLMTAMVFLDSQPDWKEMVTMEAGDFDAEGGKPVFRVGDRFTKKELFDAMLVGSVNAAAKALARSTGNTETFVLAMNQRARELRLSSPVFADPSGVNPNNRANAADVAAMAATAAGYPDIRQASAKKEIRIVSRSTGQEYRIQSTNVLLSSGVNRGDYQIVTAKTGTLPEAGYCMAQVTRNAEFGGTVVAVELANQNHFSRYQDIQNLTEWAFEAYRWR